MPLPRARPKPPSRGCVRLLPAFPTLGPRDLDQVAERLGAGRVLCGTDLLDLPISWSLAPTLFARLRLADKRLILGGNLARILAQYSRP